MVAILSRYMFFDKIVIPMLMWQRQIIIIIIRVLSSAFVFQKGSLLYDNRSQSYITSIRYICNFRLYIIIIIIIYLLSYVQESIRHRDEQSVFIFCYKLLYYCYIVILGNMLNYCFRIIPIK